MLYILCYESTRIYNIICCYVIYFISYLLVCNVMLFMMLFYLTYVMLPYNWSGAYSYNFCRKTTHRVDTDNHKRK